MKDSTPFQALDLTPDMQKTQLIDMFTRIVVHYGLWFNEVQHQMGMEKAPGRFRQGHGVFHCHFNETSVPHPGI